uniref:Uncharacterized protein n=1 Tax=Tanacetum cinerariifolium TaxID=118510 RepID=A0A6L2N7W5_TANCI|nr:hypothetical protein [Tanacetum cinerariifolium]
MVILGYPALKVSAWQGCGIVILSHPTKAELRGEDGVVFSFKIDGETAEMVEETSREEEKESKRNTFSDHQRKNLLPELVLIAFDYDDRSSGIEAIDADEDMTLVNDQDEADMFDVNDLGGEEVFVTEQEVVSTAATTVITEELTLAQALKALKTSKPKDDVQAKINDDYQLAERLQPQEQEESSNAEKATLFVQLLEKKRKHFTAKKQKRRGTNHQHKLKKKIMCTYLKNMKGHKLKDLKLKDFDKVQEIFDKAFKRVNTFEPIRSELVEGKEKRAGKELVQERTKTQKVEDNKETAELKQLMEIIQNKEEVAIDVIPLAVKSLKIVD